MPAFFQLQALEIWAGRLSALLLTRQIVECRLPTPLEIAKLLDGLPSELIGTNPRQSSTAHQQSDGLVEAIKMRQPQPLEQPVTLGAIGAIVVEPLGSETGLLGLGWAHHIP